MGLISNNPIQIASHGENSEWSKIPYWAENLQGLRGLDPSMKPIIQNPGIDFCSDRQKLFSQHDIVINKVLLKEGPLLSLVNLLGIASTKLHRKHRQNKLFIFGDTRLIKNKNDCTFYLLTEKKDFLSLEIHPIFYSSLTQLAYTTNRRKFCTTASLESIRFEAHGNIKKLLNPIHQRQAKRFLLEKDLDQVKLVLRSVVPFDYDRNYYERQEISILPDSKGKEFQAEFTFHHFHDGRELHPLIKQHIYNKDMYRQIFLALSRLQRK